MSRVRIKVLIPALLALGVALSPAPAAEAQAPAKIPNEAILSLWLDKDGGYRDGRGGYYNPKAGTYTDEKGGVVDNWGGYTYTDGSYKLQGDYYDVPKRTVFLAGPEKQSTRTDAPPADVIKAMRENAGANGLYDKDLTRRSMFQAILRDHGQSPPGGR